MKVYAFNPPTEPEALHDSNTRPSGPITNMGTGTYYAGLGMRRADVDRRTRALNLTGKGYLGVHEGYDKERAVPEYQKVNAHLIRKYGGLTEAFQRWTPAEQEEFDSVHAKESAKRKK